jgi:alpha/beta superfamily hydrolase
MAELIIPGPAGRIEARYEPAATSGAPIALILHSHPLAKGSMQDPASITLFDMFVKRGFGTLRFNFRGVGRTQGDFDSGMGELADAAQVLDYLEAANENPKYCWVAGHSFGAYICLQLLMRRPEIDGFIAVSPPANHYDLTFLAPCPASGVVVHGEMDRVAPPDDTERAVSKIRTQRGMHVDRVMVPGANHMFNEHLEGLEAAAGDYLDKRLASAGGKRPMGTRR